MGVFSEIGEPTRRCFFFAKSFDTNAPSSLRSSGVRAPPDFHFTDITLPTSLLTPVTDTFEPNARPLPARTPETTSTPGAFSSAFAEAMLMGLKLSLAVSA